MSPSAPPPPDHPHPICRPPPVAWAEMDWFVRLDCLVSMQVPETKGLSLEQIEALFLRRGQRDTRAALG